MFQTNHSLLYKKLLIGFITLCPSDLIWEKYTFSCPFPTMPLFHLHLTCSYELNLPPAAKFQEKSKHALDIGLPCGWGLYMKSKSSYFVGKGIAIKANRHPCPLAAEKMRGEAVDFYRQGLSPLSGFLHIFLHTSINQV